LGALTLIAFPGEVLAASEGDDGFGLLIDASRCIGCRRCMRACRTAHPLRGGQESPEIEDLAAIKTLTAYNLTYIHDIPTPDNQTRPQHHVKIQCMHCQNPACASACPVAALYKTPEGAVNYDESKCLGCRYCMMACPFQIPTYEWESPVPRVRKCTLCYERLVKGEKTACSEDCPVAAITFGKRSDLVEEANKRIAAAPDKYANYLYGLKEAGGTSNLYVSDLPFEKIGLPTKVPKEELPDLTWRALSKTPHVAVGVSLLMAGLNAFTHRKQVLAKKNGRDSTHDEEGNK
jgi:formate dehydrogenase iron-sulfur subunit